MSLEIRGLTKSFGRFPALNDVSLSAADGEFLALLGPSGSGKTTLLRAIAGLEPPDAGQVSFRGEDILAKPVRRRGIGFVFQHYALFRHMSAADNIAFGMRAKPSRERKNPAEIRARVEELLNLVQLEGLGGRYPSQLSGGQRQRVALARALAIDPSILLLDEPFGALDAKVRRELRRWLRDLHERTGITTLFVTHDQEEALELADRVALLKDGRIEQIGAPEELYHEPATPFVFDFLGDSVQLPCEIVGGKARIGTVDAPVLGQVAQEGPAIAFVRPDAFDIGPEGAQGLPARIRNVLKAGPDTRLECVLDSGQHVETRLAHEAAQGLSERQRVTLTPRAVRIWPDARA
jgi:sulfate transport system ATP-binding protein